MATTAADSKHFTFKVPAVGNSASCSYMGSEVASSAEGTATGCQRRMVEVAFTEALAGNMGICP